MATDVMTVGTINQLLPGRAPREKRKLTVDDFSSVYQDQRIRDLELVCKAQQKAINYLLVSLTVKHARDLREKIWPDMEAADMVLNDE